MKTSGDFLRSTLQVIKHPLVRLAVTLTFFWLIFHAIRLPELVNVFITASPRWLAIAELITGVAILVQVSAWKLLINLNKERLSFARLVSLSLQALLFAHILPGTFCGDAFRLFRTSQLIGEAAAISSIVASRTAELIGTLFIGMLAVVILPAWFDPFRDVAVCFLIASIVVLCCVMFSVVVPAQRVPKTAEEPADKHLFRIILETVNAYSTYRTKRKVLICTILLGTVGWWLLLLSMICFGEAVSVHVPWAALAVGVPLSVLIALLPISFNGVGLREGILVGILAADGMDVPHALAIAILIDVQLLPMIVFGAILWLIDAPKKLKA